MSRGCRQHGGRHHCGCKDCNDVDFAHEQLRPGAEPAFESTLIEGPGGGYQLGLRRPIPRERHLDTIRRLGVSEEDRRAWSVCTARDATYCPRHGNCICMLDL